MPPGHCADPAQRATGQSELLGEPGDGQQIAVGAISGTVFSTIENVTFKNVRVDGFTPGKELASCNFGKGFCDGSSFCPSCFKKTDTH